MYLQKNVSKHQNEVKICKNFVCSTFFISAFVTQLIFKFFIITFKLFKKKSFYTFYVKFTSSCPCLPNKSYFARKSLVKSDSNGWWNNNSVFYLKVNLGCHGGLTVFFLISGMVRISSAWNLPVMVKLGKITQKLFWS